MPKMRIGGYPAFPATEPDRLGPPHDPARSLPLPELSRPVLPDSHTRLAPASICTQSEFQPLVPLALLIGAITWETHLPHWECR
jgi:hypothetical protein